MHLLFTPCGSLECAQKSNKFIECCIYTCTVKWNVTILPKAYCVGEFSVQLREGHKQKNYNILSYNSIPFHCYKKLFLKNKKNRKTFDKLF